MNFFQDAVKLCAIIPSYFINLNFGWNFLGLAQTAVKKGKYDKK